MIKKIGFFLCMLFLLLVGLIDFLFYTTTGLKLSIHLYNQFLPGKIHYAAIHGRLSEGFSATKVSYTIQTVTLSADKLNLQWHGWHFLLKHNTKTKIALQNFVVQIKDEKTPNTIVNKINIAGFYSLNGASNLKINWQNYHMPINQHVSLVSKEGSAHITGNYHAYQAEVFGSLNGINIPGGKWLIHVNGDWQGFKEVDLTGNTLNGQMTAQGQFGWYPNLTWSSQIQAKQLHLREKWVKFPESIDFSVGSQGVMRYSDEKVNPLHLNVHIVELTSQLDFKTLDKTLSKLAVKGEGQLTYDDGNIAIENINLHSSKSQIAINGFLNQYADLNVKADLLNMREISPNFSGELHLSGHIKGAKKNPFLSAKFSAKNLKLFENILGEANISLEGKLKAPEPLNLNVTAKNLIHKGKKIDDLSLHLTREIDHYHFLAYLKQKFTTLSTVIDIRQENQIMTGMISTFNLQDKKQTFLSLKSPIQFTYKASGFNVSPTCLSSSLGKTCITHLSFNKTPSKELSGQAQINTTDLSFMGRLFPEISHVIGNINLNLSLSGNTDRPLLVGALTIKDAAFAIPRAGIKVERISLSADADANGLIHYQGKLTSKNPLLIKGETFLNKNFTTRVSLQGNDITVANTPYIKVNVSPDLLLSYDASKLNIIGKILIPTATIAPKDLTTTVTLPGEVTYIGEELEKVNAPVDFYSSINLILGDNVNINYSGLGTKLSGKLLLTDKPGGDTTASGVLNIEKGKYKAYGQDLTIRKGKLIYTGGPVSNPGISLEAIRQMNVVNTAAAGAKGPSYASIDQVVGVRLAGSLTEPKVTLFSEPAGLSQSNILSYLVLGRSTSQSTNADAGTLLSALSFLDIGSHAENTIKNQINHTLGIDLNVASQEEYSAQNNSVVENTSLILGKALSPKLYFNYSLGLIEPINIFTITYKVTDNINLKSEHSTNGNGVDLFYHFSVD